MSLFKKFLQTDMSRCWPLHISLPFGQMNFFHFVAPLSRHYPLQKEHYVVSLKQKNLANFNVCFISYTTFTFYHLNFELSEYQAKTIKQNYQRHSKLGAYNKESLYAQVYSLILLLYFQNLNSFFTHLE